MRQLYVLQREFGIGAHEALHQRPAWEIDNLFTHYLLDRQAKED